jgi:hypothetical protein
MTTVTVPAVVATPTPAPALSDLNTVQLSERMRKLAERHDVLKASVSEFELVRTDLSATLGEFQRRLGAVVQTAPVKKESTRSPRTKKDGETGFPSLKEVVLGILQKHPDGLDLNGIRVEVDAMVKRNEYASNAKSLSAVVSQAVNNLKQENLINHDRENKKYTRTVVAA